MDEALLGSAVAAARPMTFGKVGVEVEVVPRTQLPTPRADATVARLGLLNLGSLLLPAGASLRRATLLATGLPTARDARVGREGLGREELVAARAVEEVYHPALREEVWTPLRGDELLEKQPTHKTRTAAHPSVEEHAADAWLTSDMPLKVPKGLSVVNYPMR